MSSLDRKLYSLISKVRESCAGCAIEDIEKVLKYLAVARCYVMINYHSKTPEFKLLKRLDNIRSKLKEVKEYGDRLEPDQLLCDILSEMLADEQKTN